VYLRGQTLMAMPFNPARPTAAKTASPVVEGVLQTSPLNGMAHYDFSTTGTLVYLPAKPEMIGRRLVWVSREGRETFESAPARPYHIPRISPDGSRVAVGIEDPQVNVWMYGLQRGTLSRVTSEGGRPILDARRKANHIPGSGTV
jgi:serine/threonine-protein kinase